MSSTGPLWPVTRLALKSNRPVWKRDIKHLNNYGNVNYQRPVLAYILAAICPVMNLDLSVRFDINLSSLALIQNTSLKRFNNKCLKI